MGKLPSLEAGKARVAIQISLPGGAGPAPGLGDAARTSTSEASFLEETWKTWLNKIKKSQLIENMYFLTNFRRMASS